MDLFSSSAEDCINKKIEYGNTLSISSESDLVEVFDLNKCLQFINNQGYLKVCLQFPDSLLQYSVRVALWLESHIKQKVFILGDTTYGSCCVDELAAEHVESDAVIHMGHACLSPTARLPVLYILPRAHLDVTQFASVFTQHCRQSSGSVLLLYDVAYHYLLDDLKKELKEFEDRVVISQLSIPRSKSEACSPNCLLLQDSSCHQTSLLGRTFCCNSPESIVYIAYEQHQNMTNFAVSLRDSLFFTYCGGEMKTVDFNKNLRRRLYLMEKLKDAKTLGILVGTLSVENFLGAIERVKKLAIYRGKRCYIFSVGKPNPAKLANFPEIDMFVLVSCPDACLEEEKEYLRPVVTLVEAELALNANRQWNDKLSVDFRDLLEGGPDYKPLPEGFEPLEADVSLIDNKIRSDLVLGDSETSTELSVREHYQISLASSYSASRSWKGLEQALGETPVAQVKMGRSGIPLAYNEEKAHQNL